MYVIVIIFKMYHKNFTMLIKDVKNRKKSNDFQNQKNPATCKKHFVQDGLPLQ